MAGFELRFLGVALACCVTGAALAHGDDDDRARARLSGFQEVPALSTGASASFKAKLLPAEIRWELSYAGLESDALQSHIHVGQKGVNGGISVFLCSNLGNGPAGTQACPLRAGKLEGTIVPGSVIGPAAQGITAGQFDELTRAIRSGVTYVNVHSATFPGGEVRGQITVDD